MLAIAFGVGVITLYRGQMIDEADNLVGGTLILQGDILYRDVFSHHFPFPYYWTAILIGLFGKSLFFCRLSVLIFQLTVFALGLSLSGDYLLIGASAVIWSLVRPFYYGNLVIYSSFSAAALLMIFLISLTLFRQQDSSPGWKHWLLLGLFSAIALLTDPLSIYAVAITMLFLLAKRPVWGLKAGLVTTAFLLLYVGYLAFSGNLQAFWNNAILFNSQVYGKYLEVNPLRLGLLYDLVVKGLGVAGKVWFNFDLFKPIVDEYSQLDQWFFTGFLYRFSIIATTLLLASRKQFRGALFLYLFAAATLIISPWNFRAQPFILIAITAIAALITGEWWRDTPNQFPRAAQVVVGAVTLVLVGWLCFRLTENLYATVNTNLEVYFAGIGKDTAYIRELSCGQPDVLLAYYPGGTYVNWFTGLEPVAGYAYMWPWVAEVGLDKVIDKLSQEETLAIVVIEDGILWTYFDTRVYLRPLDDFLEAHYHEVEAGVYISPALYARCSK